MTTKAGRHEVGSFTRATLAAFGMRILTFVIQVASSVALARLLGPEGKGVYTLALLLSGLVASFSNLGIGPSTAYHAAKGCYPRQQVFGNNLFIALALGCAGLLGGLLTLMLLGNHVLPKVPKSYALVALFIVPIDICHSTLLHLMLGAQRFKEYNIGGLLSALGFLVLVSLFLWVAQAGVLGAVGAALLAKLLSTLILFVWARRIFGGISIRFDRAYVTKVASYGFQTHLGSIAGFLHYRVDMFLVNTFLYPAAVGFYAAAVGLVEKVWFGSWAAATMLFPRVVRETDERRRKAFTPLVTRTVLWVTTVQVLVLVLLARPIVSFLYSEAFLPSVPALQVLALAAVAVSGSRVLANDISGRGRPILNTYIAVTGLIVNIVLNVVLVPKYGITGAAWASALSYSTSFLIRLLAYCRISGNRWTIVLFPQRNDWILYWRTGLALGRWMKTKVRNLF